MSTDAMLAGFGLVIVLALGCELIAVRTRLPAIVLLLPVGFLAGIATDDVHPDRLLGDAFQPLVSLGVGLILFEAGLRLRLDELSAATRRVVTRLIVVGIVVTAVGVTLAAQALLSIGWGPSVVLGAILIVSGPTVVLPLLEFVRPAAGARSVLTWEGVLIDPIGALLGVLAFAAVRAGAAGDRAFHPGSLAVSLLIGLLVGLAGALVLRTLLRGIQRGAPEQSVAAALLCVVGAVVAADLLRDDAGFVAATVMGMALANQRTLDVARVLEFQGTVVRLIIGLLFILISASVTPSSIGDVMPGALVLVAIMILILRPVVVALGTWGSALPGRDRAFMAWLAPRGIVAAATASAFGPQLAEAGVSGADRILPLTFVAIFGTVVVYGLTASPVARRLGVVGEGADVVLIVGGHPPARAIARALQATGVRVRLWTGRDDERDAALAEGLTARTGRLGADLAAREAELEDVTDALLLTDSDDFNALAASQLRREIGHEHVFSLPPSGALLDPASAHAEQGTLFEHGMTFEALARRFADGATVVSAAGDGGTPLFVVSDGRLHVVTPASPPRPAAGDTTIRLT